MMPPPAVVAIELTAHASQLAEAAAAISTARTLLATLPTRGPTRIQAAKRLLEVAGGVLNLVAVAEHAGLVFIAKLAEVTSELLFQLESWPDHIGPGPIRTVDQAMERLALLLARPDAVQPDLCGARALMIDDDRVSLKTACTALARSTIVPAPFACASEALIAAEKERFSIVFTDLMMTGMNGFQLAARLRQLPGYRDVPIVFVTGTSEFEHSFRGSDESANDLIVKPFLLTELALKALIHIRADAGVPEPRQG